MAKQHHLATLWLGIWLAIVAGHQATAADEADAVADSPLTIRPLLIGTEVPDALLRTPAGDQVSLRQQIADKPTVLVFYRGGW